MFSNNIDNAIFIDTNSKSRNSKQKIFCVLCNNEKIELICINPEENRYRCPRCKNSYQVGFEILPSEDELVSSHDSSEGAILISASEGDEFSKEDNNKSDIAVPKYMKDSETTTITYFREE